MADNAIDTDIVGGSQSGGLWAVLAPERYRALQSGAHFELSLEGGYPGPGGGGWGTFQEEVQGLVGIWQSWWLWGREEENEVRITKGPRVPGFWPQSIKRC